MDKIIKNGVFEGMARGTALRLLKRWLIGEKDKKVIVIDPKGEFENDR